jgi:hypothetical protein
MDADIIHVYLRSSVVKIKLTYLNEGVTVLHSRTPAKEGKKIMKADLHCVAQFAAAALTAVAIQAVISSKSEPPATALGSYVYTPMSDNVLVETSVNDRDDFTVYDFNRGVKLVHGRNPVSFADEAKEMNGIRTQVALKLAQQKPNP